MKWLVLLLMIISNIAPAQELSMVRSSLSFPEAMTVLQESIRKQGYTVSRVQRVDIGLTTFGYNTDKYRVVFFGKLAEVNAIAEQYPELVPYVPLKIAIFAENEETILLASGFDHLRPFYTSKTLLDEFDRWEKDTSQILDRVRMAE